MRFSLYSKRISPRFAHSFRPSSNVKFPRTFPPIPQGGKSKKLVTFLSTTREEERAGASEREGRPRLSRYSTSLRISGDYGGRWNAFRVSAIFIAVNSVPRPARSAICRGGLDIILWRYNTLLPLLSPCKFGSDFRVSDLITAKKRPRQSSAPGSRSSGVRRGRNEQIIRSILRRNCELRVLRDN
jgi:hypothetical protein